MVSLLLTCPSKVLKSAYRLFPLLSLSRPATLSKFLLVKICCMQVGDSTAFMTGELVDVNS